MSETVTAPALSPAVATRAAPPVDPDRLDVQGCIQLWRRIHEEGAAQVAGEEWFPRLCRRLLDLGENLLAHDVVQEGLLHRAWDSRLRQLAALALARSGATEKARAILEELRAEGSADEETLGILARTCKDLALATRDRAQRDRLLRQACDLTLAAYRETRSVYPGINAATLLLLLRDPDAETIAREVRDLCLAELGQAREAQRDLYWTLASLGEANLILREWTEARRWYGSAARYGRGRIGALASTRRNAHLVLEHYREQGLDVVQFMPLPRVAVFSGHMLDRPGRSEPRFPPELEPAVAQLLREKLGELEVGEGYASAACGGDLLFLEVLQDLGATTHIVLPYERDAFVRESVDITADGTWKLRFDLAMRAAGENVSVVSPHPVEAGGISYEFANWILHGLASMRAEQLATELVGIAVWNGRQGDGPGGTSAAVQRWRRLGMRVEVIRVDRLLRKLGTVPAAPAAAPAARRVAPAEGGPEFELRLRAMLFADVVGYSKLSDLQIQPFVEQVLGMVARLLDETPAGMRPEVRNTWGDGLYLVFRGVRDAGLFALALSEHIGNERWVGLPSELNLRIALHAGPVHHFTDPVTKAQSYTGAHVSRAARMEPVTPPGLVYASQEFAAVAASEQVREFTCDYVGRVPLAKQYGNFPMYHVRRRSAEGDHEG